MIVIDSDVLIDVTRNFPPALAWFQSAVSKQSIVLPGYAAMELFEGCQNLIEQQRLDRVLASFRIAWPSPVHCDVALDNFKTFHLSQGMDLLDALIAQTAVELGEPLYTFNIKHMSPVRGLVIQQPYTR